VKTLDKYNFKAVKSEVNMELILKIPKPYYENEVRIKVWFPYIDELMMLSASFMLSSDIDVDCWRGFLALLKSASGALIVSDILEASASRGGYGGFGRAYVNYWLRELDHRAECFRECGIDVSLPA